jgi:hypothetical protein
MFTLFTADTLSAIQCHIIKINSGGAGQQSLSIDPVNSAVSVGDCVVWFNGSKDLIKVSFGESEKCAFPVGFLKGKGCFDTDWMPAGTTGSLQMTEKGTSEFTITTKDNPTDLVKGVIMVK